MVDGKFELIPMEEYEPAVRTQILTDTIPETWHPVDGQHYTSRTAMQKVAKAHGFEELGNERIKPPKPEPRRPDPERIQRMAHVYDSRVR